MFAAKVFGRFFAPTLNYKLPLTLVQTHMQGCRSGTVFAKLPGALVEDIFMLNVRDLLQSTVACAVLSYSPRYIEIVPSSPY